MSDSAPLDLRIHAVRPDLADISLRSVVQAPRYVTAAMRQCIRGVVPLLAAPDLRASRASEIRYGEFLDVFEFRGDGFAWVQNRSDRYVGYIESAHVLSEEVGSLSNRVNVLQSYVYARPDMKSAVVDRLTLGSHVKIDMVENGFIALPDGGFLFHKHTVLTADSFCDDYAFTAGRLLGIPYLWGGRTPAGIDCSGLVQLALELAGFDDCPRDSDQQCAAYGQPLNLHWRDTVWRRGDLVFFPGHVGIMTGTDHMIHANSIDMQVVCEPLTDVVDKGYEIIAKGRPAF